MNTISKLPGPLLVFLGAFCLSFGGLIVKSFEGATLWQILFWRQFFFIIIVSLFLLATYKKEVFKVIYKSGSLLKRNGLLVIEVGNHQYSKVSRLLRCNGFKEMFKEYDINRNVRCIMSTRARFL